MSKHKPTYTKHAPNTNLKSQVGNLFSEDNRTMIALGLLEKSYSKLIQTCLSIIRDARTIDRIGLFQAKGVGVDTRYKPPIT